MHSLDQIAVKFDSHGFRRAGRKNIQNIPAHGERSGVLNRVDPRVARLQETPDAGLAAFDAFVQLEKKGMPSECRRIQRRLTGRRNG